MVRLFNFHFLNHKLKAKRGRLEKFKENESNTEGKFLKEVAEVKKYYKILLL